MKTKNPLDDDDAALRGLLKEWKVETPLPPHFQEQVWRRIEREEARPAAAAPWWTGFQEWIANALPRPALAVAYVAVLVAAGAGVGWTQAQHETSRISNQLSLRYVRSVDPYQAPY